jgi:hypothetical protein
MIKIKLYDHENSFFDTDIIKWEKCYDSVNDGDIVVYTRANKYFKNASKHILFLLESPEIIPDDYQYIYENYHLYDAVFTFSKKLLGLEAEMIHFNSCATTWLHPEYRQLFEKNKFCSMILSAKNYTSGHGIRHQIANMIIHRNLKIDLFGKSYRPLVASQEKGNVQSVSNGKILGLKDYMFSVVTENCKEDYYFSEKLIDCFLSGTIPIYWGCPSIHLFFNKEGIFQFETAEECISILEKLTKDDYESRSSIVNENFKRANQYTETMTIDINLFHNIVI